MTYLFATLAVLVTVFGMEGRGTWSRFISIAGGWLWLFVVIYAFYIFMWQKGMLFLLGTFILGAILQRILRPLLNPHGRPPQPLG